MRRKDKACQVAGRSGHARLRADGSRGMTLLELIVALMIAIVVIAGVLRLSTGAQQAFDTVSQDVEANYDLRRAGERVADQLRQSAVSHITVETVDPDADTVTFQIPVGKIGENVVWGAEGHSGWYLQFRVTDGDLVRRVLDESMNVAAMDEVLVRGLDVNIGGRKGFTVTLDGTLVTIEIRVPVNSGGETWRKEIRTSVTVRNV